MERKYDSKQQHPRIALKKIRELYPTLTEEEVKIARNNMERHAAVIRKIWLRLQWDTRLQKKFDKILKEKKEG